MATSIELNYHCNSRASPSPPRMMAPTIVRGIATNHSNYDSYIPFDPSTVAISYIAKMYVDQSTTRLSVFIIVSVSRLSLQDSPKYNAECNT